MDFKPYRVDCETLVLFPRTIELKQVSFLGSRGGYGVLMAWPLGFEVYIELPLKNFHGDVFLEFFVPSLTANFKICLKALGEQPEALEKSLGEKLPLSPNGLYSEFKQILKDKEKAFQFYLNKIFREEEDTQECSQSFEPLPSYSEVLSLMGKETSLEAQLETLTEYLIRFEKYGHNKLHNCIINLKPLTDVGLNNATPPLHNFASLHRSPTPGTKESFWLFHEQFFAVLSFKYSANWSHASELDIPNSSSQKDESGEKTQSVSKFSLGAMFYVTHLPTIRELCSLFKVKRIDFTCMGNLLGIPGGIIPTGGIIPRDPDHKSLILWAEVYCKWRLSQYLRRKGAYYKKTVLARVLKEEDNYFAQALKEVFPSGPEMVSPIEIISNFGRLAEHVINAFERDVKLNYKNFQKVCPICKRTYGVHKGKICDSCHNVRSIIRRMVSVAEVLGLKEKLIKGELSREEKEHLFEEFKKTNQNLYNRRRYVDRFPNLIKLYRLEELFSKS